MARKRKYEEIIQEFCDEKGYDYEEVAPVLSEPYKIMKEKVENGDYAYLAVPGVVSIRGRVGTVTWDMLLKAKNPHMLYIASIIRLHGEYVDKRYKTKKKRWK